VIFAPWCYLTPPTLLERQANYQSVAFNFEVKI